MAACLFIGGSESYRRRKPHRGIPDAALFFLMLSLHRDTDKMNFIFYFSINTTPSLVHLSQDT